MHPRSRRKVTQQRGHLRRPTWSASPELRRRLLAQATRVADRLVAQKLRARVVHLKIRDAAFVTETRQLTLAQPTDGYREIYGAACRLLDAVETEGRRFRLTGVGVAGFEAPAAAVQLDLLAPATRGTASPSPRSEALQAVLSAVRERHGKLALYPADAGAEPRAEATGAITRQLPRDPASHASRDPDQNASCSCRRSCSPRPVGKAGPQLWM